MTFKLRWVQCSIASVTVARLAALMLRRPYKDDEDNWGFSVDLHEGPRLEGRFIERIQATETVKSPLGQDVVVSSLEYRVTRFRMDERWPAIELLSPPRSTSNFTNWLWSNTDQELSPGTGSLDLVKLLAALEGPGIHKVAVVEMRVKGISLPGQVVAKLVAVGKGDVRPSLVRFLSPPAVLEAVGATVTPKDGKPTTVRVSRTGLMRLTSVGADIVPVLRAAAFASLVDE